MGKVIWNSTAFCAKAIFGDRRWYHIVIISEMRFRRVQCEAGGLSRARRPCLLLSLLTLDTENPPSWQACKISNSTNQEPQKHTFKFPWRLPLVSSKVKSCGCSYVGWAILFFLALLCPIIGDYPVYYSRALFLVMPQADLKRCQKM